MKVTVIHKESGTTFEHDAITVLNTPCRFEVVEHIRHGIVTLSTSYHKSLYTYTEEQA